MLTYGDHANWARPNPGVFYTESYVPVSQRPSIYLTEEGTSWVGTPQGSFWGELCWGETSSAGWPMCASPRRKWLPRRWGDLCVHHFRGNGYADTGLPSGLEKGGHEGSTHPCAQSPFRRNDALPAFLIVSLECDVCFTSPDGTALTRNAGCFCNALYYYFEASQ